MTLDAKDIMSADVAKSIAGVRTLGLTQYKAYVEERLSKRNQSVDATIHRNNILLFTNQKHSEKSVEKQKNSELKSDRSLFSRLYIASQCRDPDLDTFFSHKFNPSHHHSVRMGR
ncbi:hypothetical protein E2C01_089262 [Portunus trituberculatus]|uniref:Uncharacterized protein n=1 Tax=Portunus trituberculatus TaxID=210409 RepID=A0A5B7JBG3_PORTR|nr:hypothetical protein [Portunus trituberculatus]